MEKFEINVATTLTVTAEDIDDIMCAALENGICYWCCEARVVGDYLGEYASDQISRGGKLILVDAEEDVEFELTREKLLSGIKQAREEEVFKDYNWWDGDTIDTCSVDADVADAIVQFALFDEIIFG